MLIFLKNNALIINLALCCLLLSSCNIKIKKSSKNSEFKTLQEIQHPSKENPSLSEQFSQARKKTEFLDDQTETMLNNHKRWFIFSLLLFLGLVFQSFINYRQD